MILCLSLKFSLKVILPFLYSLILLELWAAETGRFEKKSLNCLFLT